jgi:hypothetical protein
MLKNDRGSHIGDLRASDEPVDDEGVNGIGVRDADMDQEVLGTRDDETSRVSGSRRAKSRKPRFARGRVGGCVPQ